MSLDLLPAFLMAVLACWLGLSLLVRAPRARATQAFAWLCLHLTLYGLAIVLDQLAQAPAAGPALSRLQLVETALLPPVFLQFIMLVAGVRRARAAQRVALALDYTIGVALAGYALFGRDAALTAPEPQFPHGPLALIWTAQLALPPPFALLLAGLSYRQAGEDDLERRRRALFMIAALVAVSGALWAAATRGTVFSQAPGHALI